MNYPRKLLWKTLVWEYYRQNAGFFLFFFILFFGIVAPSQQLAYHYSIILGMLSAPLLLALVLFLWLLYAAKCFRWVISLQQDASHSFLLTLPLVGKAKTFRILLEIQIILFLPIILYAMAVVAIAILQSAWIPALVIILFIALACTASTLLYRYDLFFPGRLTGVPLLRWSGGIRSKQKPYWLFLLRFFLAKHKALLIGVKLFMCGILYLLLRIQTPEDYDIRMPFLVFIVALFGHGALIYQVRTMEETQLLFYRGLPVALSKRFLQYMILYLLTMLPEIIIIGWLIPAHIRIKDAVGFVLAGYSNLLLLNSCLFTVPLQKSDFLKLSLGVFGILYFGVLSDNLILLSGLFLVTAAGLFFRGYCRWEG